MPCWKPISLSPVAKSIGTSLWLVLLPNVVQYRGQPGSTFDQLLLNDRISGIRVFHADRFLQRQHSLRDIVVVRAGVDYDRLLGLHMVIELSITDLYRFGMALHCPGGNVDGVGRPLRDFFFKVAHQEIDECSDIVVMRCMAYVS